MEVKKETSNLNEIIFETKNLSFNNMIQYKDIQIKEGKVNFIIGKSGTGKSTLLRLFNGTFQVTVLYFITEMIFYKWIPLHYEKKYY